MNKFLKWFHTPIMVATPQQVKVCRHCGTNSPTVATICFLCNMPLSPEDVR